MTRIFLSLLLVVLLGASSRPCAGADKANFAYSALSGLQAPLWVAKEAGFFKKHDIDAQVLFIVGGRVISQAMFAGELQMGLSSMAALLPANAAGGDLTYVAYFGSKTDYALFSTKDITDVRQLRGKRIGIGQFGGGPDFASRIVLEKHGLVPDKDVRIVQMLVPDSGRLAALRAGVKKVIWPARNRKDLDELPREVRNKVDILFVDTVDEALKIALASELPLSGAAAENFIQPVSAEPAQPGGVRH